MKEHIYTIPVNEAFDLETECPLCSCRRKLETEAIEYELGAAMMEPDHRIGTNKTGFCGNHYEKLFKLQKNRLSLGLVLDTHMENQNRRLAEAYRKTGDKLYAESRASVQEKLKRKLFGKGNTADTLTLDLLTILDELINDCAICNSISGTMNQFADTVIWLFFREADFRSKFESSKGFCLLDFRLLLSVASKTLSSHDKAMFLRSLLPLMIDNLSRVQGEVNWFTQMFDHRNKDSDWKQSKNALQRAMCKFGGPLNLE